MIKIIKTTKDDLENVATLWNDGNVMQFVGFPNGLGVTAEGLENWLERIEKDPLTEHFSIYHEELGYCGESFYSVDKCNEIGMLDIKLFEFARGKGIARYAFEYAIDRAFQTGQCSRVYVDPSRENKDAWCLYGKLGFYEAERPEFLEPSDVFLELTLDIFSTRRKHDF